MGGCERIHPPGCGGRPRPARTVPLVTDHEDSTGGTEPAPRPLESMDAERHVARLTGMTPEAARTFLAFHSGLRGSCRFA